jgi:hypothetical protein
MDRIDLVREMENEALNVLHCIEEGFDRKSKMVATVFKFHQFNDTLMKKLLSAEAYKVHKELPPNAGFRESDKGPNKEIYEAIRRKQEALIAVASRLVWLNPPVLKEKLGMDIQTDYKRLEPVNFTEHQETLFEILEQWLLS